MPELSILIPCLNESSNLPSLIERLQKTVIEADLDVETIILDDASEDDTIVVAKVMQSQYRALNIRVVHRFEPRRGYGALVRYGLAYATGRYCLLVAADGAHPIEMLPSYLAEARKGAQLVQCSRYEKEEDSEGIPGKFKLYQSVYRAVVRALLAWDIRDPTCSFKLVDRVYLMALGIRSNGLAAIPEIPFKVHLSGGKVSFIGGAQSFRQRGISQFKFLRESSGYGYVLIRAWLHRVGILSWF
ncbi:MAG: glycosyltransferase family 2 protein [Nitrospirota bacterium]